MAGDMNSRRVRVNAESVGKTFYQRAGKGQTTEVSALKDVSFSVNEKEIVGLVGPSGCGKSTILGLAAGLIFPSKGRILIDGEKVIGPNEKIGFMLQKDLLLPWKTIIQNVELGQKIRGVPREIRREKALGLLKKYGLAEFCLKYPSQLSGGMRQRVSLARTLVIDPEILLLDEPFSALDYQTRLILQQDVYNILREQEKTVIFITHDIGEAITISDRVLVMSRRPGRIKMSIDIDMPHGLDLMRRRKSKEYGDYYQLIWDNLDIPLGS